MFAAGAAGERIEGRRGPSQRHPENRAAVKRAAVVGGSIQGAVAAGNQRRFRTGRARRSDELMKLVERVLGPRGGRNGQRRPAQPHRHEASNIQN